MPTAEPGRQSLSWPPVRTRGQPVSALRCFVQKFGIGWLQAAWNKGDFASFWNAEWPLSRVNIDFWHRPVTPGVAGSSPVHSAIIIERGNPYVVAPLFFGNLEPVLEYGLRWCGQWERGVQAVSVESTTPRRELPRVVELDHRFAQPEVRLPIKASARQT
jgi:hypothetical protein